MAESAVSRFLRGVREPWDLMGRMRQDRRLWSRYWRTVLVQAGLTLVAGLAIFWVGKQGADAWNDAFGPEEPETVAPASAARSGTADEGTPGQAPSGAAKAGTRPGASTGTSGTPAPASSGDTPRPRRAPPPAAETPPTTTPGGASKPARSATPPVDPATPPTPPPVPAPSTRAGPTTGLAPGPAATTAPEEDGDDEEAADAEDAEEADPAGSGLEAKIKALQEASPGERGKRTAELVAAALEKAKKETARAERSAGKRKGQDEAEDLKEAREAVGDKLEELAIAADALAQDTSKASGEARRARRRLERQLDRVQSEAAQLQRKGAAPLSAAEQAQLERARAALKVVHRHERGLAGRLGAVLALLAAIYASLGIAQTGVLALSRDFHDALSRELSLLVNVAPEDPPMRPKIRLDLPWVRRKANRRAQFFLGFLPGAALISFIGWLVPPHRILTTVLTTLWAAYWWMVMTAGQSARAWSPPETTPRPWYLRAWFALTERVFLFRWALPRWWGRIWERFARRFYGPSERVEEQPLEFAGLALSRALTLVPVVKLLLRPVFSVAAARLLVEHAAAARLPVAVTAAEVADAAAHAPDPEARAHSGVVTSSAS